MAGDDLDDGLDYSYDDFEEENDTIAGEAVQLEDMEDAMASEGTASEQVQEETKKSTEIDAEDNTNKRKRKSDSFVIKKKQRMEHDIEQKLNLSTESPERIAEFFGSKVRVKYPDLTPLELSELYIPKNVFKYTGFWEKKRNLDGLKGFLEDNFKKYLPEKSLKKNNKKNKGKKNNNNEANESEEDRKFILILSSSAIRVCDVHRATKDISTSSIKLISKNKLKDDMKILKTTRSRILTSTPARITKLLKTENSSLKLSEIKVIIIDSSYLDQKKRNIWDSEELFSNLKDLTIEGAKIHLF
ncbi:Cms1 protein [Saccharomycopsis crataegensis]|uniref:Cms1 protein n=1 Tax=Saccharomycopsis crataegensis TaxID=43959 RepID=A0AAV5QGT4_9ASCO|nr:Cms1 protein [Saccharomycopsis crataegensis]